MTRLILAAAVILAWGASAGRAQQPTFRSGVDLVTIDVTAIDGNGRPIADLPTDRFRVLVDGTPRRVVAAQFIGRPSPAQRLQADVQDHFTSNEYIDEGRLVVIAVDQRNIRPLEGDRALRAASRFISALDPADRVGVASLTHVAPVRFTRDRTLAAQRIQQLVGEADPVFLQFNIGLSEALAGGDGDRAVLTDVIRRECGQWPNRPIDPARLSENPDARDPCPEQIEQEARAIAQHARTTTTMSMAALRGLIDSLREFDGPKTIVLLSEGLVAEPQAFDFGAIEAAAQTARVTIYVLQLDVPLADAAQARPSPTQMADRHIQADGLGRVAGAGRGAVFEIVGSDPAPLARLALELSGYYLVAFEPRETDRDGRQHRIRVSIGQDGVTVRARPTFTIESARAARATNDDLVTLLRTATLSTELPVRVATFVCREPATAQQAGTAADGGSRPSMQRVIVAVEADPPRGTPGVALGFVLHDDHQVIVASGAQDTKSGAFAFSAIVPAGDYTLKVGAIDGLGRRGTVERSFPVREGPPASAPGTNGLATSDLILASVPQPATAPLQPIVDRAPPDRMLVYLELYAQSADEIAGATVAVEIVRATDGVTVAATRSTVHTSAADLSIARAVVATRGLSAGRYVARATVSSHGRPATIVSRAFLIT